MTVGLAVIKEMVSLLTYMYLVNNILKTTFLSSTFMSCNDYFLFPYNMCDWGNSISEACFFPARSKQSIAVAS